MKFQRYRDTEYEVGSAFIPIPRRSWVRVGSAGLRGRVGNQTSAGELVERKCHGVNANFANRALEPENLIEANANRSLARA